MNLEKLPIPLILVLACLFCSVPLTTYAVPPSWEGFYHARIAENMAEGHYFYDSGSFGPEGRVQVYPPLFHFLSAPFVKFTGESAAARWGPPVLFVVLILVWYFLVSTYYRKSVAALSSLFLLCVPAFVDLGFLFSPLSLSLILVFLAFTCERKPILSGVLGGLVFMTQITTALYFVFVLLLWSFLDSKKRINTAKIIAISLLTASPYLLYFLYYISSFEPVLGFLGFRYLFSKTTFVLPCLALLGLRKDPFALSLGAGVVLSFVQPTAFCYAAFPLALFSSFFVRDFLLHRNAVVFVLIFWLCLIPSQEYVSKLQPAASEYSPFLWLRDNSIPSVVASGWYQAPILAAVSERVPVLGFGFPDKKRVEDMDRLYHGESDLLDYYDITYVYCGAYEQYDYQDVNLPLDRIYSGEGAFYKREPPLIYILITVDVEPDLPPVLSTHMGIEEGLPFIVQVLRDYDIPATFFVLGETAALYPSEIKALAQSHEVACHSMYHENMHALSYSEKEERVQKSTRILQELTGAVTSFRAPGHSYDSELGEILANSGYTVEASASRQFFYPYTERALTLLRVPISHTPSYFYPSLVYPRSWADAYMDALEVQQKRVKIIVIGMHPWEFVDVQAPGYEPLTQACGRYTKEEFEQLLQFLEKRNVTFLTMRDLHKIWTCESLKSTFSKTTCNGLQSSSCTKE